MRIERSRPAWARGLKRVISALGGGADMSRPAWARGLKHIAILGIVCGLVSRPAWARGLKLVRRYSIKKDICRALRGRVD